MSAFKVQGWCPGALRPMMSGDGLVVRIRPQMARLTAVQAHGIALAALRHGNGLIDLSARANIQLRGIRPNAHAALLADLDRLDLIDPDVAAETRRNIVVSPFWVDGDGTADVVASVLAVLQRAENAGLPGKFGISVDAGAQAVLHNVASDIRIGRLGDGWLVQPDGFATGAQVRTPSDVGDAAQTLIRWFLSVGVCDGRGRMAALAGRTLPLGYGHPGAPSTFVPQPGPHPLGQLVAAQFGQMRAETFASLAMSPIRITPWRMMLLEGVRTAPDHSGLITDPRDPLLNVTACTGAPGCPQALQPTRTLARALAPEVPHGQHLHVSGCAKGCAHPKKAQVTLVATQSGYDVVRNGRASDAGVAYQMATPLFKVME